MKLVKSLLSLLNYFLKRKPKQTPVQPVIEVPAPSVDESPVEEPILDLEIYKTIPLPTGKTMTASVDTLRKVAELTDVRADYMALIIALESSFDYTVKAKTSSATGWFQIINRTWGVLMSRYARQYDIPTDGGEDLRKDPRINALMGAELIKENIKVIKPAIGRDLTLLEIYLAHFFGAGHAKRFILAPANANAVEMFTDQARANPSIFYKNGSLARTIKEVSTVLEKRIATNLKLVNKTFN